jgi:hypothetical protein
MLILINNLSFRNEVCGIAALKVVVSVLYAGGVCIFVISVDDRDCFVRTSSFYAL